MALSIPVDSRGNLNGVAKYLRTQGYSGQDNDIVVAWLVSEGINKGSLNDMMYDYLGTLGYIGTYRDRWYAWKNVPASPLVYSPLGTSYSSISITPITITNTERVSFRVKGMNSSITALQYFMRDRSGGSYIYYRPSDGRFRVRTDNLTLATINNQAFNDGLEHFVEIQFTAARITLFVDGIEIGGANGTFDDFTVSTLADPLTTSNTAMYGVTVSASASWPMQSEAEDVFDGTDEIGSNDLVYVGAPAPITPSDTIETTKVEDV